MRGESGERCFLSKSCRPGGACIGLKMVNLRFGGAKKPPDNVSWVRMLPVVDEHERKPSMVSADLDIKMAADCCKPFEYSVVKLWWSSSICWDVLRMHFSALPEMEMPPPALSVDEWADVERTNCRTCFCCAVKNVAPCDDNDVSGCCKKLVNLLFVPLADVEVLLLVAVVWLLENFCTCFSVTILMLDWALSCCISVAFDVNCSPVIVVAAADDDDVVVEDDCKLWLRVFGDLFVLTFTAVAVDLAVAVDVVVVVDDLSSSSSLFSSPGAVTMYCGGSASSTDIFVTLTSTRSISGCATWKSRHDVVRCIL